MQTQQPQGSKSPIGGCGIAAVGCGGIVGLLIIVAVIGAVVSFVSNQSQSQGHSRGHHRAVAAVDWCDRATDMQKLAAKEFGTGAYQSAYDDAVQGLRDDDRCDDDTAATVLRGYLLSMKGLAEHRLSEGDSRTDLNEANMLLEKCQTDPSLYGTHIAAGCESQQQNNISATTDWDINQ